VPFESQTLVRNIPESEQSGLEGVDLGMEITFVGLIQELELGTYRLSKGGHAQIRAALG
jgi:hypothetical protein